MAHTHTHTRRNSPGYEVVGRGASVIVAEVVRGWGRRSWGAGGGGDRLDRHSGTCGGIIIHVSHAGALIASRLAARKGLSSVKGTNPTYTRADTRW